MPTVFGAAGKLSETPIDDSIRHAKNVDIEKDKDVEDLTSSTKTKMSPEEQAATFFEYPLSGDQEKEEKQKAADEKAAAEEADTRPPISSQQARESYHERVDRLLTDRRLKREGLYYSQRAKEEAKEAEAKGAIPPHAATPLVAWSIPQPTGREDLDTIANIYRSGVEFFNAMGIRSRHRQQIPEWSIPIDNILPFPLEVWLKADYWMRESQGALSKVIGKHTPDLLKFTGGFVASMNDMPKYKVARNALADISNQTLDWLQSKQSAFSTVNFSNMKFGTDPVSWGKFVIEKDGKKQIVGSFDYVEHHLEESGLTGVLNEVADNIAPNVPITEHERDFIGNILRYTIEFGTPLALFPVALGARLALKAGRFGLEKWFRREFYKKFNKHVPDNITLSPSYMKDQYKLLVKDKKNSTVYLPDGTKAYFKANYNIDKYRQNLINRKYLNMALGGGVAAGVTHSIIAAMTDNSEKYSHFSYIAGLAGMFKGGYGMSRALFKTPGATALLTGSPFSLIPPRVAWNWANAVAASDTKAGRGVQSVLMKTAGAFYWMLRREGKLTQFDDTTAAAFMRSQAADVDFFRAIKILSGRAASKVPGVKGKSSKDAINELNNLSNEAGMSAKSMLHLADMYKNMSAEDKVMLEQSVSAALRLSDDLTKKVGANGMGQHFFFIEQVVNLGLLRAQRNLVTKAVKFGEGPMGKQKSNLFVTNFKKLNLLTEMEAYEKAIQHQIGTLGAALNLMKKDPATADQMVNFFKAVDNELQIATRETENVSNVFQDLLAESGATVSGFNRAKLDSLARMDQEHGGLMLPRYGSDYFQTPSIVRKGQKSETQTDLNIDAYRGDVNELIDYAWRSMKSYSDEIYAKVNMNQLMPASPIVERLNIEFIGENRTILKMMENAGIATPTKDNFITLTKRQYLTHADDAGDPIFHNQDIGANLTEVANNAKADPTAFSFKLTDKGTEMPLAKLEEEIKALKELDDTEALVKFASELRGATPRAQDFLDSIFKPVLTMQQAHNIRMTFWRKVGKNTDVKDQKWLKKLEDAESIDDAFTTNSLEGQQSMLEMMGISEKEIQKQWDLLKAANENYRDNIGSVWNNFVGKRLLQDTETLGHAIADEEKMITLLLNNATFDAKSGRALSGTLRSVDSFNRMFPKSNPDQRRKAQQLLLHSIGYKLSRPGSEKLIESINVDNIKRLIAADVIDNSKGSGDNLITLITQLQKKIETPKHIEVLQKNLERSFNSLTKSQQERLSEAFPTTMITGGGTAKAVVEALFDLKGVKGVNLTRPDLAGRIQPAEGGPFAREGRQELAERSVREYQTERKALGEDIEVSVNAQHALDNLEKRAATETIKDPIDTLTEIIPPKSKAWDYIHDLILDYTYKTGWSYTNKRSTWNPKFWKATPHGSPYAPVRGTSRQVIDEATGKVKETLTDLKDPTYREMLDAGYDGDLGHISLQMDINLPVLSENILRSKEILARIAYHKGPKSFQEFETMSKQLDDIFAASALTRGIVTAPDLLDIPRRFGAQMLITRLYSLARNVVSPQYLATEAAIRELKNAQSRMLAEIVMNPDSVKILHKIIAQKGQITAVESKAFLGMMFKSFGKEDNLEKTIKEVGLEGLTEQIYEYLTDELPPEVIQRERIAADKRRAELIRKRQGPAAVHGHFTKADTPQQHMMGSYPNPKHWYKPGSTLGERMIGR